jgi:CRISPR/Cas system CSM-associated protein Csm2 small subunit
MKNIEDLKKQLGITNEQMYQITAYHQKGHSVANISKSTGIDQDKIREFLIARDKKPIERERKKEPASAATDTSSMDVKQIESSGTVSASKYTIAVKKSQAQRALDITKKTLKDIYEYMNEAEQRAFDLGEAFGRICTAIEEEEE